MIKKLLSFFLTLFFFTTPVFAVSDELIEKIGDIGTINWSKKIVISKGIGIPLESPGKKPGVLPETLNISKENGFKNLLQIVNSVRVDSTTKILNYETENERTYFEIKEMVKNAQIIKKEYLSDGTVELTLGLNINIGFSQLVLPREIEQLETIKPLDSNQTIATSTQKKAYTGLIIEARGVNIIPSLSIKIFDEKNEEVYGPQFVSREYAVQVGMCGYLRDIEKAKFHERVRYMPLIIKALRSAGNGKSDIVISNGDALKLKGSSKHLSFMKQCHVLIVVD